ncbi:MAG: enoyl-CoA hydratase/isomerase family protein [Deltaproteobacteria bacterium]|nr:enoyl-CoA hydratase/isomerase family protein [Deltaproteobacteria bacterium]
MAFETILLEKKEQVGLITLNRPQKFNTFSTQMAEELNATLRQLDEDTEVRVVIIKGAGKAFSTGIDVSEFHGKTPSEYHRWLTLMDQMHFTIASIGKPVIAMVHGYAVANGAGLVAAADFAIVAEGTQIGTTAINVGLLCTGPIIPMSYGLGKKKTLEMLLSGDMIDAREAERLGLVNKVVPAEKLEEETFAFAQKLIAKSPVAIEIGKKFYYQMIDMPFRQRFVLNSEIMARLCITEDAQEGVKAFIEKRKPVWKGK